MKARGEKVVCVTAYDAIFASIVDEAGVDVVLVGDSAGNTIMGGETTLGVSLVDIIYHTKSVRSGIKRALLVADLPFGSYQPSIERAVDSAIALVKAGADAVKLEGPYVEMIEAIIRAGIPVMGHVGMTPQSVKAFGGFRIQGKGNDAARVIEEAKRVDACGVFSMVLEVIPGDLAKSITGAVQCPTIGIGAGAACDGQIQVIHDVLGLAKTQFRHAKPYVNGAEVFATAIKAYAQEVRTEVFPTQENTF